MSKFEMVARYYSAGIWDARKVKDAVTRGWISEEEYVQLTGEEFAGESRL